MRVQYALAVFLLLLEIGEFAALKKAKKPKSAPKKNSNANSALWNHLLSQPIAQINQQATDVDLFKPGNVLVGHGTKNTVLQTGLRQGFSAGGGKGGGGFSTGTNIPVLGLGNVFTDQDQFKFDAEKKEFFAGKNIGAGPFGSVFQTGYGFNFNPNGGTFNPFSTG